MNLDLAAAPEYLNELDGNTNGQLLTIKRLYSKMFRLFNQIIFFIQNLLRSWRSRKLLIVVYAAVKYLFDICAANLTSPVKSALGKNKCKLRGLCPYSIVQNWHDCKFW